MGLLRSNRRERRRTVAILAKHVQITLRLAKFPQGAAAGLFVIDDDDIHHASTNAAARRVSRPGDW